MSKLKVKDVQASIRRIRQGVKRKVAEAGPALSVQDVVKVVETKRGGLDDNQLRGALTAAFIGSFDPVAAVVIGCARGQITGKSVGIEIHDLDAWREGFERVKLVADQAGYEFERDGEFFNIDGLSPKELAREIKNIRQHLTESEAQGLQERIRIWVSSGQTYDMVMALTNVASKFSKRLVKLTLSEEFLLSFRPRDATNLRNLRKVMLKKARSHGAGES